MESLGDARYPILYILCVTEEAAKENSRAML